MCPGETFIIHFARNVRGVHQSRQSLMLAYSKNATQLGALIMQEQARRATRAEATRRSGSIATTELARRPYL